jgi:hypothetical protein
VSRLVPGSLVGRRWASVVAAARIHLLDPDADAMRLWRIENGRLLAAELDGPMIYLAIGHQVCQYTGQTYRTLQERLTEHLREEPKARTWSHLGCIRLSPDTPAVVVDKLENRAHTVMRPLMGKAKPRVLTAI